MSVDRLLTIPQSEAEWQSWSFNHAQDHIVIIQATEKQKNINLTQYQLDPINFQDIQGWQFRHLQTHIDMDAALGIQSADIEDFDIKDPESIAQFISSNWQEHNNAHQVLGI